MFSEISSVLIEFPCTHAFYFALEKLDHVHALLIFYLISIMFFHDGLTSIKRFAHWGPVSSMAIVASLTISTLATDLNLLWSTLFQITMCLTLYNMWYSMLIGPGYGKNSNLTHFGENKSREIKPKPMRRESDRYCRRCGYVILKKHHHCPWINSCVGRQNEKYFVRFLVWTIVATSQSIYHLFIDAWVSQSIGVLSLFNIGLSIGVLVAVSSLLYTH